MGKSGKSKEKDKSVYSNQNFYGSVDNPPYMAYGEYSLPNKAVCEEEKPRNNCGLIITLIVIGFLIAGGLACFLTWAFLAESSYDSSLQASNPPSEHLLLFSRIDCYPEGVYGVDIMTPEKCLARGCAYEETVTPGVPWCYVPQGDFGFRVVDGPLPTPLGQRWVLQRKNTWGIYAENFPNITFDVEFRGNELLRFKFETPEDPDRYEVPWKPNMADDPAQDPRYRVEVYNQDPFSFGIIRISSGAVIWDTGDGGGGLVFSDQFLQIATFLPSLSVYGFGENKHLSFKHDLQFKSYPIWARDQPPHTNEDKDFNLYSSHPFYECVENDGQTHGVLLWNSNAMDYTLTPYPMLTYKTLGGILDFYVFFGPSPENVIQQYTAAIGRPMIPPYWSLGFQLSRYGYKNTSDMRAALERTQSYGIPIDLQYADIDYMYRQRSFTLDMVNFTDLPEYFTELRAQGMRSVLILNPTVEISEDYSTYVNGRDRDVYVRWESQTVMPPGDYDLYNNTYVMGTVWPEWIVNFVDYFRTSSADYVLDEFTQLNQLIPFDGIWLDMNEIANFDTNGDKTWNWPDDRPINYTLKCPTSPLDDPPYRSKAAYMYDDPGQGRAERLSARTLCMETVQGDNMQYKHYDVHNLYGHQHTVLTYNALVEIQEKRPMIITRSTFPGDGQYGGRWLGDNTATWLDLRLSIIGLLEFNLFGIPYIGADICGFFNDCPAQLCMRWQQLGAFYPYSRNHNHEDPVHQDPGFYGEEVAIPTREALLERYRLLPYLYTLFYRANTQGGTVVRPLHHEFPQDSVALEVERQFLWGPALLISPILEEDATSITYYLPAGRWYNYYDGENITEFGGFENTEPVTIESKIFLHVRGGYIIPTQQPEVTTTASRLNPFGLRVALDAVDGSASGELFWDDGDSLDPVTSGQYWFGRFDCSGNVLSLTIDHQNGTSMSGLLMDAVEVYGVSSANFVYVNGAQHDSFTYSPATRVLNVSDLGLSMETEFTIEWRESRIATLTEAERVDCCPESGGCNVSVCADKACIWDPQPVTGLPACFIDRSVYGYRYSSEADGTTYLEHRAQSSMFGGDLTTLALQQEEYDGILRIKIYDPNSVRYEVPFPELSLPPQSIPMFNVRSESDPFSLFVERLQPNVALIDTSIGGLTFSDKFLQIAWRLPSGNVYGLGEHEHPSLRHSMDFRTWPMFSRDQPPSVGANLYSVMPLYLCIEEGGKAHGVFFHSSNAMEVSFSPAPALTFRTVSGVLDFYVIAGDNPGEVIERFTRMIGTPFLPPYWSLGFHLSRYGFNAIENIQAAVNRTIAADIPLDVVHLDIDTMDERKSFTWDSVNFPGLPSYIEQLHSLDIHIVQLLNPFLISNETDYTPYDLGLERDVFIKFPPGLSPDFDINGNDILLGWVWPKGRVVFPDYFKENTTDFWEDLIVQYYNAAEGIKYDGLWLDMNEPANFGTNEERAFNWPEDDLPYWTLKCPVTEWDDPPYKPDSVWGPRLSDKTLCMVAEHQDGALRHYDVHSLHGSMQSLPSISALRQATGKRGLLISRSMYAGNGHQSGHWLGDNASIWPHLKPSIIGMLEFNMFGVPFVGVDICGYFDNCTEVLCQRWHQLGAFYPFSRNHNGINYLDQDPGVFGPVMIDSTRRIMNVRYTLLPYLYTLFYKAHTRGSAVVTPLFFSFSTDRKTYDIDEQFMWGDALLISPVLRENTDELYAYFLSARWFDYYSGGEFAETGRHVLLNVPADHIPIHVLGGKILPTQTPGQNTVLSRLNGFGLIVAPDESGSAYGELFWDDGESIGTVDSGQFCVSNFSYSQNTVRAETVLGSDDLSGLRMDTLRVFGVTSEPTRVTTDPPSDSVTLRYHHSTKELVVENAGLEMAVPFSISWEF